MTKNNATMEPESPGIRVLSDSVARRIAAGEVIDRPYSIIRELLDNALDAEASQIQVEILSGGIQSIVCTDNGSGMSPEDLKLCVLPHATSKIRDFEDLYRLSSLGFRGDALASIAACSRLEILSRLRDGQTAHRLKVSGGKQEELREDRGTPGTKVTVEDLFYSMPGRKKFLKTPSAEGTLCFNAFLEKVLPFPDREFRFFTDGKLKLFLPGSSQKDRIVQAYSRMLSPNLVQTWEEESEPFRFSITGSSPSLYRRDRKYIQIYVNNRRVNEYSLTQAVEYGYGEFLPGGCYPHVFVFITVPPDLVDFNIHPSKKEVRFRDLPGLHRALTGAVKQGLKEFHRRGVQLNAPTHGNLDFSLPVHSPPEQFLIKDRLEYKVYQSPGNFMQNVSEKNPVPADFYSQRPGPPDFNPAKNDFRYLGQIMNLFLVVEKPDTLLLIDQHAAHERILFDQYRLAPPSVQELLVPHVMELEPAAGEILDKNRERLVTLGFEFEKAGGNTWQMLSLPSICSGMEDEILELITEARGDMRSLEKEMFARAACRKAVKDGDVLDRVTAEELAARTLSLPEPRCPHGRPVWFELSREELYRLVGRTF